MTLQARLRTIAGTVLVTSLAWAIAVFQYWPPAPGAGIGVVPSGVARAVVAATTGPAGHGSTPLDQARTIYQPIAPVPVAAAPVQALIIPVQGVKPGQLIDTFTQARENGARVHDAIDIMAPRGTPVLAAAAGTVERLYTSAAGGLTIYMRLDDRRYVHYYAHLDSYAAGLSEGQRVAQGQVIGAVGFTGNADPAAPHLHFAIQLTTESAKWYEPSTALNPYPLLTQH